MTVAAKPHVPFDTEPGAQSRVRVKQPVCEDGIGGRYNRAAGDVYGAAVDAGSARAALNREQLQLEKELQRDLIDQIDRIRQGAKTGSYLSEQYDNVLRALTEYRLREGDPAKDLAKKALAHKVLDIAAKLLNQQQKDEAKLVDKYINEMGATLSDDQKARLAEAAKSLNNFRPAKKK